MIQNFSFVHGHWEWVLADPEFHLELAVLESPSQLNFSILYIKGDKRSELYPRIDNVDNAPSQRISNGHMHATWNVEKRKEHPITQINTTTKSYKHVPKSKIRRYPPPSPPHVCRF